MRTPGYDAELAAGFLLAEGLIRHREEIIEIAPCRSADVSDGGNILNVFLSSSVTVDFEKLTRHVFASSSCGLCGKASIDSVHQNFPPLNSRARMSARVLLRLPGRLRASQRAFRQTGGVHAAAIATLQGDLMAVREDVGRHNAVDKVLGWGLLNGHLPMEAHVLLVSGRASFEIMQKALAAGVPIVAAISAPSSLAVDFARDSRQTLVGFLRGRSMNIYSEAQRITEGD
jgi:FdhD protein